MSSATDTGAGYEVNITQDDARHRQEDSDSSEFDARSERDRRKPLMESLILAQDERLRRA